MSTPALPQGDFKGLIENGTHRFTQFIAAGGEGQVFHLNSHGPGGEALAGKVYGPSLTRAKIKKLNHMIGIASPEVRAISAWPVDLLATSKNKVIGFAMPFVAGAVPLHLLLTPKTRLKKMPDLSYAQLVHIAENLARAVASLHKAGVIIGDINGQNFLIRNNGTVQAIDCDSMQIGTKSEWASGVGVEEYIAPELQGKNLQGYVRSANHDAFALAVLLYELLVFGRHPFGGHDSLVIGDAIRKKAHVFARNKPTRTVFDLIGLKPTDLLTPDLLTLFTTAFGTASRPSASDWADALKTHRQDLQPCIVNGNHSFPATAKACPWCALEQKKLPKLFGYKVYRPPQAKPAAKSPPPKPAATVKAATPPQPTPTATPAPPQTRPQAASTPAAPAKSPPSPTKRRPIIAIVLSAVLRSLWIVVRWLLRLLLTPVSTTRAVTMQMLRAAWLYVVEVGVSIFELVVQVLTQVASVVGNAIAVAATAIWNAICIAATVVFNIALILGFLYALLGMLREFLQSFN